MPVYFMLQIFESFKDSTINTYYKSNWYINNQFKTLFSFYTIHETIYSWLKVLHETTYRRLDKQA